MTDESNDKAGKPEARRAFVFPPVLKESHGRKRRRPVSPRQRNATPAPIMTVLNVWYLASSGMGFCPEIPHSWGV